MRAVKGDPIKGKKLANGGVVNGDPVKAESTATRIPMDPILMDSIIRAAEARRELEKSETDKLTGGFESGRIESTDDPITAILGLGPQAIKSIIKHGGKTVLKSVAKKNSQKKSIDLARAADDLVSKRANDNLDYISDRIMRRAQAEDRVEISDLQNQVTDLLNESTGLNLRTQANNIIKGASREDAVDKHTLRSIIDQIEGLHKEYPNMLEPIDEITGHRLGIGYGEIKSLANEVSNPGVWLKKKNAWSRDNRINSLLPLLMPPKSEDKGEESKRPGKIVMFNNRMYQ